MPKVSGLLLASVILCAGGAKAGPLEMHMHAPTIHEVNPQPLPPVGVSGGGAGKTLGTNNSGNPNETFGLNYDKMKIQYQKQQSGTGVQQYRLRHPPNPCRGC